MYPCSHGRTFTKNDSVWNTSALPQKQPVCSALRTFVQVPGATVTEEGVKGGADLFSMSYDIAAGPRRGDAAGALRCLRTYFTSHTNLTSGSIHKTCS